MRRSAVKDREGNIGMESTEEILEDADAQLAKSKKTREMVEDGPEGSMRTHQIEKAEQQARGEDVTGIF